MAELHGISCRPFLPSVLIKEGVGGMGGRAGWNGRWQKLSFGTPMSNHDTHTVVNDTPMDHINSGNKSRSPLPNWHSPWVPLFQPFRVGKMPFRKVDQLTFKT